VCAAFLGRPCEIHLLAWTPALLYYAWLCGVYSSCVAFGLRAHRAQAIAFVASQAGVLFLLIGLTDALLFRSGRRWLRAAFILVVHSFMALLYLDAILYRVMSLHLGRGVGVLLQGGPSRLAANLAHTGIPADTLRRSLAWSAVVFAGIALYTWVVARSRWSVARSAPVGRWLAGCVYLVLIGQILLVGDDVELAKRFADLRSALPFCLARPVAVVGRRFAVPGVVQRSPPSPRALGLAPGGTDPARRPDVFIIVLESTRGDFVVPGITPNLARFKGECLPFPDSMASGNASHIAWYSLLTANHGLYFSMDRHLRPRQGSVPIAMLRRLGYKVHVLCSSTLNYHEMDRIAFGDDLSLCDSMVDEEELAPGSTPAERDGRLVDELLWKLPGPVGGRLFFVFLHASHHDYDFPTVKAPPFAPYAVRWDYTRFEAEGVELERIINRYRNSLHFEDELVGRVFAALRAQGLYESSMVAVVGDHGEEFLEHGKFVHASNLYRPQTYVPFLLRLPGAAQVPMRPGEVLPIASQVDLLPTLLDHLGFKGEFSFDGRSLLRSRRGQVVITAENGDLDPVSFCLQSDRYRAFFQFERRTVPTARQRTLVLTELRDSFDRPLGLDLFSPQADQLLATNFQEVLCALFPTGPLVAPDAGETFLPSHSQHLYELWSH